MTAAELYSLTRKLTGTDATTLPDADLQDYMRISYRRLVGKVRSSVDENFFYDEWTTDVIAGQREYKLAKRDSNVSGCNKVISVTAKLSVSDTEFKKVSPTGISMSDMPVQRLSSEQPKSDPTYYVSDESIFLSPTPDENVPSGLVIYGISDPIDPSTGSAESVFKIPLEHHHAIAYGMVVMHYIAKKQADREAEAKVRYDESVNEMIMMLLGRVKDRFESVMPSIKNLE